MGLRAWKKVYESDLNNIISELKELITTPAVIFLEGPVGAGKTTFTRYFINKKEVQSPTYSLLNEYENFLHADLYRLQDKEELIHLEIPMYLEDKEFFIIEWGLVHRYQIERLVGGEFNYYQIKIEINESNSTSTSVPSRNYLLEKI